jgi:hypothetical protein
MKTFFETITIAGRAEHVSPLLEFVSHTPEGELVDFASLLGSVSEAVTLRGELRAERSHLRRRGLAHHPSHPLNGLIVTGRIHHCDHDFDDEDVCLAGLVALSIADVERISDQLPHLGFGLGYVTLDQAEGVTHYGPSPGHDIVIVSEGVPRLSANPRK